MSYFPWARGIPKLLESGQPFSTDNQNHEFTVPAGKIWQVIHYGAIRTDNSTLAVRIRRNSLNYGMVYYIAAGTTPCAGPEATADEPALPILIWEGDQLRFYYGSAQSTGTSLVWAVVLEFDLTELLEGKKIK